MFCPYCTVHYEPEAGCFCEAGREEAREAVREFLLNPWGEADARWSLQTAAERTD